MRRRHWFWLVMAVAASAVAAWTLRSRRVDPVSVAPQPEPASRPVFEPGRWPKSARPLPDGSAPDGFVIKGNANSMLFHTEDSPNYRRCRAKAWFRTPEDAVAAGFQPWNRKRPKPT